MASRPFLMREKEATEVFVGSSDMHTGLIGTALYVAPEVDSSAKRALYNKVSLKTRTHPIE